MCGQAGLFLLPIPTMYSVVALERHEVP